MSAVADSMRPFPRALALSKDFEHFSFTHVPREENREADRLANEALDRG